MYSDIDRLIPLIKRICPTERITSFSHAYGSEVAPIDNQIEMVCYPTMRKFVFDILIVERLSLRYSLHFHDPDIAYDFLSDMTPENAIDMIMARIAINKALEAQ